MHACMPSLMSLANNVHTYIHMKTHARSDIPQNTYTKLPNSTIYAHRSVADYTCNVKVADYDLGRYPISVL